MLLQPPLAKTVLGTKAIFYISRSSRKFRSPLISILSSYELLELPRAYLESADTSILVRLDLAMALSLEKLWSGPLALHWPVECLVDISYDEEKAGVRS